MANKYKKLGIACLSLFTVLSFASCSSDEIIAKPTNYDSHIIYSENESSTTKLKDVWNNVYKIVEKAYHDGDSFKTDVVTDVMNTYAVSMFGQYNKKSKGIETGDNTKIITLKEAYKDSISSMSNKETADAFILAHPIYHVFKDEAKKEHDKESEYKLLKTLWETIEERISIAMYDKISGSTYKDRNIFSEKEFVKSLRNDMKKIKKDEDIKGEDYHETLLYPDIKKENIWDYVGHQGFLNRDIYQYNYNVNDDEGNEEGKDISYVEDELIPTIYNDLLIEQYIMIENPNAIGRSNARKVNIFTVNKSSDNDTSAKKIIQAFRDRIFCLENDGSGKTAKNSPLEEEDFIAYSKLINCTDEDLSEVAGVKIKNGFAEEVSLKVIANSVYGDPIECNNYKDKSGNLKTYYSGSEYGAIIKEYDKISDNPDKTDSSVLSTYTGSGAYLKEFGLKLKQEEVSLKSHITTGWYVKDGLSSLPDSIKNRLFSSAVANDKKEDPDTITKSDRNCGEYGYEKGVMESNFVAVVNGKYYLKTGTQPQGTPDEDDIVFEDSGNYYIVQIEEAVNLAKIISESGFPGEYSVDHKQIVKNNVSKILAKTESYQTLAKKHWLEKMGLSDAGNYHDQQVYNYFVATYPKLFE